jgi:hypothetical protein
MKTLGSKPFCPGSIHEYEELEFMLTLFRDEYGISETGHTELKYRNPTVVQTSTARVLGKLFCTPLDSFAI